MAALPWSDILNPQIDAVEEARLKWEAAHFLVKKIPYAGERGCLKFDRRQWRPRRIGAKELRDSRLSRADYLSGMHFKRTAMADEMRLLFTPEFSKHDDQLRLAIAQHGYSYAMTFLPGDPSGRVPEHLVQNREALESLCNKATASLGVRAKNYEMYVHTEWCTTHGGYIALHSAIAYRAWRQAQDSATIAKELGLSWCAVRQILRRICETARRLGLETFPRHHSCFGRLPKPLV